MDKLTPIRIQRKRTNGWRMPENTVSVARPPFGNPFRVGAGPLAGTIDSVPIDCPDAATAVSRFREYLRKYRSVELAARIKLRGKNLACFCPLEQPCHADVLLEIANAE